MAEKLTKAREDALLKEIRERFDAAEDAWRDIRAEGAEDMRYVAGDPWSDKEVQARDAAGRPHLALDELGQYFNQVVNDVRANPRAVKFSPTGDGANDETAEFYANKMREIEYRSQAQIAYTTAFENAVQRSYGWVRLNTRFADKSFNQDLWIEDVPNPDMVLPDPEAKRPDSSDMKYCFVRETWRTSEFQRRFPKAKVQDFSLYLTGADSGQFRSWMTADTVTVAEYWTIETQQRELLAVADAQGNVSEVWADEVTAPMGRVMKRRTVDEPKVMQYLTNGVEILEQTEWPGKYIPLASCFGKILYIDDGSGAKRHLMSMTRLARDPYKLYCYYRTCEAELVGMTPKTPFIGYSGQFRGFEPKWGAVNHEPVAYLEANALTEATGNNILPLPQRQPYEPPIQALEVGAEAARRAIQAAMGVSPLPTSAQRRNEKSGVALKQIEENQQRGSFHFVDHYEDMIRHVGVMVEDLMDKVYDTARDVGIRRANETAETMRINDPTVEKPVSTKGQHLVTISTGPSFESEREAASDFADTLAGNPQIFPLIGPLVVKLKNLGPIGDEIADALEVLQPPELRAKKKGNEVDPAQLMQQIQQSQQMIDVLTKELEAKTQIVETDGVKAQASMQEAQLKAQADLEKVQLAEQAENERTAAKIAADERSRALSELVKLAIAEINAEAAESRQHAEMARTELGFRHEHAMKAGEAGVKAEESERARQFQREEGEAGLSHEAEQAEAAREAEERRMSEDDGA